jgi:hypothetical protein
MSANCKYSHTIEQEEGLPIVHCSIKRCNDKTFLEMKEVYEQLHNGQIMSFNDNCEYAYSIDGLLTKNFIDYGKEAANESS